MGTSNPILHVEHLTVTFDDRNVIDDVSFSLNRGETIAIIGPNGAGKTVLLRAILGLVPYKGIVRVAEGSRIGYVPQRFTIERDFPLTVEEFLSLRRTSREKMLQTLQDLDLHHRENENHRDDIDSSAEAHERRHIEHHILPQRLGVLSSGQLQKILIAWALLGDPHILLFDEPTVGLDIVGEESIYELLERIQRDRNLSVLFISHDLSITYRAAQRVLCLNQRSFCFGPPRTVLDPKTLQKLYGYSGSFYAHNGTTSPQMP